MAASGSGKNKDKVMANSQRQIRKDRLKAKPRPEVIALYKRFFKIENERIKMLHRAGAGGIEIARRRADLLDVIIHNLYQMALDDLPEKLRSSKKSPYPFTLVAVGGYGRGTLNPGSDVDLLFLCPGSSSSLAREVVEVISQIQLVLYDLGLILGHATRSIRETIQQAKTDHSTITSLLDARFLEGDEALAEELKTKVHKDCLEGREAAYLKTRREDFLSRHEKYDKTVYLQEPNIKEGCGSLRDYHNTIWIMQVKYGVTDLQFLVEQRVLSRPAFNAMQRAYDFLMRVRNELHWAERPATNLLTLRLQGVVAQGLGYPQDTILRQIEAFMRDYYRHSRALYLHSTSIMQSFRLLMEDEQGNGLVSFLANRNQKEEHFDGLIVRDRLIYPENKNIFRDDPTRLMRIFLRLQQRHLRLSPQMRKLIKANYHLIDTAFRYGSAQRDTFESILSEKGNVARPLRQMHRVGFLGKYLPEFGELDCLVQHEFFHRYTADEHTLKTIDALDSLSDSDDPQTSFLQKLYHELEDPYILYLALILHDTGRAENYRFHTDASLMLAQRVCKRLNIRGERRTRLLFLVDNHLTLWRTATTRNLEDPNVIQEFAGIMQNRSNLETLLLMTYADSKGTNAEAWSTWKETLMMQLFANTVAYLEDNKAFVHRVETAKTNLREAVTTQMAPDFETEIDAHFQLMPERYFFFRDEASVMRHVELFRRFMTNALSPQPDESLRPAVNWVPFPNGGYTQMELCCWDRANLLVKIAGALAANKVNILSADIFTRGDNLILDIFRVCTTDLEPVTRKRTMTGVEDLLHDVLESDLDMESWNEKIVIPAPKPRLDPANHPLADTFPSRVLIANNMNPSYTVLEIQVLDRLGLLYDVFRAIAQHDVQVVHSRIATEKGAAIDSFYLTDSKGKKLKDRKALDSLKTSVEQAIRRR